MKVVILCGGIGSRLQEETESKPKPMIEIGGKPILWHIMKTYSHYGFNDFVICLGYKGYIIKEYFKNYFLHQSDVTIDLEKNDMQIHKNYSEPWRVTLADTGDDAMTGGRLKRVQKYIGDETFCLTYGDGVCDMDINKLVEFHQKQKSSATVTAVHLPGRFGSLDLVDEKVMGFREKMKGDEGWINGGFFVLEPEVFDHIEDDMTVWERDPMEELAKQKKLVAYRHKGFWHPMDTMRDKRILEELWETKKAPWKKW